MSLSAASLAGGAWRWLQAVPGAGIVQGLAVTLRNMLGSYFDRGRTKRLVTEQYPEERPRFSENTRTFPFLVYEGDPEEGIRCVACKICEKECPPQCIFIEQERDAAGKPLKRPKVFNIDISVCMSCQICVEVCPFESIRMDIIYEESVYDRFHPLLRNKTALLKSNAYYHDIHPLEATETDARIIAARKKKEAASKVAVGRLTSSKVTKAVQAAQADPSAEPPPPAPPAAAPKRRFPQEFYD